MGRLYNIINALVGRLTDTIKLQKTTAKQMTWSSTSNPYFWGEFDVSMSGYTPVAVGYEIGGTQGSLVCISALAIRGNKVVVEARMHGGTPSTTTQNTIYLTITYLKTALFGGGLKRPNFNAFRYFLVREGVAA